MWMQDDRVRRAYEIAKLIQLFAFSCFPFVPIIHLLQLPTGEVTEGLFFVSNGLRLNCVDSNGQFFYGDAIFGKVKAYVSLYE